MAPWGRGSGAAEQRAAGPPGWHADGRTRKPHPALGERAPARIQLQQAQSQLADDARSSILQAFGGLLVVAGAVATWRQVHISREGQITDRFTRAIDQLGSENRDVRIGGIYALGRIAANSPDDRSTIQYVLGAFVRDHASWPVGRSDGPEHPTATVDEHFPWLTARAPDIHAAVGLLARRPPSRDARKLYLSRTDLRGFHYDDARLEETEMRHANLARTSLRRARLDRADLSDADLRGTDLSDARLEGTILTGAHADQCTVWPADVDTARRNELGIIQAGRDGPSQTAAATA